MGPNVLIQLIIICTCRPIVTRIYIQLHKDKNTKLNTHYNIYTLVHQTMDSKQQTYYVCKREQYVVKQHQYLGFYNLMRVAHKM